MDNVVNRARKEVAQRYGSKGFKAAIEFNRADTATEGAGPSVTSPCPVESGQQNNRDVLSSSFNMDVGETVVVGTSKVRGAEEALIVLLTAVPASAPK